MSGIPGFEQRRVKVSEIELSVHVGGSGPPLILLHGFPQNHMCWAKIAPALSERFLTLVPDLRGYGDSDIPPDDAGHTAYSKRLMAEDISGLIDAFGIGSARIAGHDRGARAAYRLALDSPQKVERLVIIEVVPTGVFWANWNAEIAYAGYHWTFLAQPAPLAERMISGDPEFFTDWTLASWTRCRSLEPFAADALAAYRRQMADPKRVAAMCADYRAGFTTDRRLDDEDRRAGKRIEAPMKFLWSDGGFPSKTEDPLAIWCRWSTKLTGEPIPACGHFVMEENPKLTLQAMSGFLAEEM